MTAEDVERLMLDETEAMKVEVVDRVAARWDRDVVRTRSRHMGIEAANAAAREFVDANWGTLTGRLKVVSGKRLLAAIRKRLQDDYKVSFGDKRLTEAFEPSEIPAEMVEIIRRVAALGGVALEFQGEEAAPALGRAEQTVPPIG